MLMFVGKNSTRNLTTHDTHKHGYQNPCKL